jgi:tRNA(Ile)-lysidine synthase
MAGSRNRVPPDTALIEAVAGVLAAAGVGPGRGLCVAFSGGVDSTVLLQVLAGLRGRLGFGLAAAHVHHGLSPNADAWLEFCTHQCVLRGVAFHSFRVAMAPDHPAGPEAAARDARHAALAQMPCDWLVLGHHRDDQAETLLFRLLRGTGLRGAAAMAAVEPGSPGRLRPLLGVGRAEIVAFARAASLDWVEDESNADPRFARNFLRHRVFPLVGEVFPAAAGTLARAADHFREAGELLDELAALDAVRCGEAPLARERLLALSDLRVRNLLRWQMRRAGVEAPVRARLVEAVRQLREAAGQPLRLPLGAVACCAYRDQIWLEPEPAHDAQPAPTMPWRGEPELRWGMGAVCFAPVRGSGLDRARLEQAGEVVLASRWPGLVLCEAAGRPRRTFKKLCQEAGIPAWLRPQLPVLRVDGEAAWIAQIGVAAEFRCEAGEPGLQPEWRPAWRT